MKKPTTWKEAFYLSCKGEKVDLSECPPSPEIRIEDIVGVQPMQGTNKSTFKLRFEFEESQKDDIN